MRLKPHSPNLTLILKFYIMEASDDYFDSILEDFFEVGNHNFGWSQSAEQNSPHILG